MQCPNCRSQIPEGVAFCQQCGMPVSPPPPSLAPTVMASPPSSGGSDANYDPLAPTVAAPQPSYGNPAPYTNYNPSSGPGSGQAHEAGQNPYANVPYGQPQPGNVPPYAPLPPSNVPPYMPPSQGINAPYGPGAPPFAGPPPVKPKSNVGLIVGIVVAVLLVGTLAVIGLVRSGNLASQGNTGNSTSAVTPTTTLSGNTVDSTAASIITNIQMATDVDTITAQPKTLGTSFQTGVPVYVTFQFDFRSTDVTQQKPGYAQAKYYTQNRLYHTTKTLTIDDTVATDGQGYGYFGYPYDSATTTGAVEVYWCRASNCSDGKLAGTATFTVS